AQWPTRTDAPDRRPEAVRFANSPPISPPHACPSRYRPHRSVRNNSTPRAPQHHYFAGYDGSPEQIRAMNFSHYPGIWPKVGAGRPTLIRQAAKYQRCVGPAETEGIGKYHANVALFRLM